MSTRQLWELYGTSQTVPLGPPQHIKLDASERRLDPGCDFEVRGKPRGEAHVMMTRTTSFAPTLSANCFGWPVQIPIISNAAKYGGKIGVKMTKEPPKGLRANLKATYSKIEDGKLGRTRKPADFRKMLFGKYPARFRGVARVIPSELNSWPSPRLPRVHLML